MCGGWAGGIIHGSAQLSAHARVNKSHRGTRKGSYAANLIAENIYSQTDAEGNKHLLIKDILDHRKTDAANEIGDCRDGWKTTVGCRQSSGPGDGSVG